MKMAFQTSSNITLEQIEKPTDTRRSIQAPKIAVKLLNEQMDLWDSQIFEIFNRHSCL